MKNLIFHFLIGLLDIDGEKLNLILELIRILLIKSKVRYILEKYKNRNFFKHLFAVPSILFSGKCAENHVAMVASIYNNFPYPDRKGPAHVLVNKMIFDSKVMEVKSQVQISHRFIPIRTRYKTSDLSSIMYPIQTEVLM